MNENKSVTKRTSKLEQLAPEQRQWIFETALHTRLCDMVVALREEGIDTSPASLSRFIREDREKRLLEDRKEISATVNALAEAGRDGKLREGTLEAVRQRLYERAVVSQNPEEALELYAAMVKEEGRLKELELEARKVAALEQQVRFQGVKVQVMAEQGANGARGKVKAEVVESRVIGEREESAAGQTEGNERARLEVRDGLALEAAGSDGEKERMLLVLRDVNEMVNRGGWTDEKVLELRSRLAEEMKTIGCGA